MADEKAKVVKVVANYGVRNDTETLWGVDFKKDGEGDDISYVAEVSEEVAKSLIDAKRAVKAK
jgi:hypothetical protein